jgi:hypothetical protein
MTLSIVPMLVAGLVALVALALAADAWLPEDFYVTHERRRRRRAERHRGGEGLVAAGLLALSAAIAGGDRWRYTTVAVMAGVALLLVGALLNRRFLRELLLFRGATRRADAPPPTVADESATPRRLR